MPSLLAEMMKRLWLVLIVLYIFINERQTNCSYNAVLLNSVLHKGLLTVVVTIHFS